MNKTEKEQLFSDFIKKWCKKTWAGWWSIDVVYYSANEFLNKEEDAGIFTLATCHTNWQYMTAKINVNSDVLEGMENDEIEYSAVHELMHLFLNEMRCEGIEHEERVATMLARSFILAGANE